MKEYIQASAIFAGISTAGVDLLATSGTWVPLAAGETLFYLGDEASTVYLVAEGCLDVLMPRSAGSDTLAAQLGPGEVVGEIQMLTGGKRIATLRANTATRVIGFANEVLERLAETEPVFLERIRSLVLARLRRNHLAFILPAQFGDLDFRQMEEIESLGQWVTLHKGQVLFRQDEAGDGAYFLVNGLLGVLVRKPDGSSRLVNHIQHGEIVGEMALLSDDLRSATIYATRESDLLFFGKREFASLIDKHPRLLLGITRMNIERLRHSISQARPRNDTSVTALVAASAEVPLAELARRLAAALAGYCRVLHVDRKRLQAILGAADESAAAREILVNTRLPAWLSSEQGKHRTIR